MHLFADLGVLELVDLVLSVLRLDVPYLFLAPPLLPLLQLLLQPRLLGLLLLTLPRVQVCLINKNKNPRIMKTIAVSYYFTF